MEDQAISPPQHFSLTSGQAELIEPSVNQVVLADGEERATTTQMCMDVMVSSDAETLVSSSDNTPMDSYTIVMSDTNDVVAEVECSANVLDSSCINSIPLGDVMGSGMVSEMVTIESMFILFLIGIYQYSRKYNWDLV